jgi:LPS sulfotransferase NodH
MRILLACQAATGGAALRKALASLYSLEDLNAASKAAPGNAHDIADALRSGQIPEDSILQTSCLPKPELLTAARDAGCHIITTIRNPYDAFAAFYRHVNLRPKTFLATRAAVLIGKPSGDHDVLQFIRKSYGHQLRTATSWLNCPQAIAVRYEALYADSIQALATITRIIHTVPSNKITLVAAEIVEPALSSTETTAHIHPDTYASYRADLSLPAIDSITETYGSAITQLGYRKHPRVELVASARTTAKRPTPLAIQPLIDRTSPFFVVGAVRSGTTMLRDLLRLHPRLECPEETHFFRWADPFGSHRYNTLCSGQVKLMKQHRQIDKIDETAFIELLQTSTSRGELAERYGRLYCKTRSNPDARWFDKTPQNVYGILLIKAMFPNSVFVHIHRNPLNVVTSVFQGRVIRGQSLVAAINFWLESVLIIQQFKEAWPDRLIELSYENLTADPHKSLSTLIEALGEDPNQFDLGAAPFKVHEEQNRFQSVLSPRQVEQVMSACEPYMTLYNYDHFAS